MDKQISADIPENQIAIKTGEKDDLKSIDLMSAECSIRYIISVNALKEGWDCSFAYVFATIANRTSSVDVEQILGRVLRLPYTKKNSISFFLTIGFHFTQNFLGCRQMWRIRSGYGSDRLYFVCWLSPKFHEGGSGTTDATPSFRKGPNISRSQR